jgi:hypothetical protein
VNEPVHGTAIFAVGDFAIVGGQNRRWVAKIDDAGQVAPWNGSPMARSLTVALSGNGDGSISAARSTG